MSEVGADSPFREKAIKLIQEQQAKNLNAEYGLEPGKSYPTKAGEIHAYEPKDITPDSVAMAIDAIQFVLWLESRRKVRVSVSNKTLAELALEWTGE